jgi:hypothetical protein
MQHAARMVKRLQTGGEIVRNLVAGQIRRHRPLPQLPGVLGPQDHLDANRRS